MGLPLYKKIFGYFLILFALVMILLIGFPQVYSSNNSGRIDKEIQIDAGFLKNETSEIVLVYFGYVGCSTVCVLSLHEIDEIYNTIGSSEVSVYFINLLDGIDNNLPDAVAKSFNNNFKGVHLDKDELVKVTNEFKVSYTKALIDKYELNHPGYLYLLSKNSDKKGTKDGYTQKYIYTTKPFSQKDIVLDIENLLEK